LPGFSHPLFDLLESVRTVLFANSEERFDLLFATLELEPRLTVRREDQSKIVAGGIDAGILGHVFRQTIKSLKRELDRNVHATQAGDQTLT
jgi:hypothetical protein